MEYYPRLSVVIENCKPTSSAKSRSRTLKPDAREEAEVDVDQLFDPPV
jgi:hypothetical protein